jgi:hypothetical protein
LPVLEIALAVGLAEVLGGDKEDECGHERKGDALGAEEEQQLLPRLAVSAVVQC